MHQNPANQALARKIWARHSRINAAAGESHYREALVLAVASPIIAELVSGSAPPLGFLCAMGCSPFSYCSTVAARF